MASLVVNLRYLAITRAAIAAYPQGKLASRFQLWGSVSKHSLPQPLIGLWLGAPGLKHRSQ